MCVINGDNLEKKLDITFAKNLGVNVNSGFKNDIDVFKEKIILLANTGRYNKLVESLLRSKDRIEFNSYVFEAYFAYDFEVNSHQLEYEVKNLSESLTSIDYCYETEGRKIYFELRVINQRAALTDYMEAQLKHYGFYEILQGGEEEQQETIRLQNSILSKCQGKEGNPIKFGHEEGSYNFIVVFVSALHLGMIDKADCLLAMYGDEGVHPIFRRGVFGLCQQLSEHTAEEKRKYYEKFKHFRETIHGVLFVRNVTSPKRCYGDLILNLDLEYFLVGNNNLSDQNKFNDICIELQEILKSWTEKKAD